MTLIPKGQKVGRIKPKRLEDKPHLRRVAELPCCCCGRPSGPPHHLIGNYFEAYQMNGGPVRGWGLRAGDNLVIPLCFDCHLIVHGPKGEIPYLEEKNINGLLLADRHWEESHAKN